MIGVWMTNKNISNTASQQIRDETQLFNKENTFIDDVAFNYIREIYSAIDFDSDFKSGDTEMYDFYKEQYLRQHRTKHA